MADLQVKPPTHDLSHIPLWWERTSVPETPVGLPIGVEVNVTADALLVHAKREGTLADEDVKLRLSKDDLISIEIFVMPDVWEENVNPSENDLSWVIVRHRDPFGVEPFFESLFTSDKAYWAKAIAKVLKERAVIDVKVIHEDHKSRKTRLLRESV